MSEYENNYGDTIPSVINPGEKHIACVLLVDTSGSMNIKGAIDELNKAMIQFGETLRSDTKASGCADVCVLSFNEQVQTAVSFCPAIEFSAPQLKAYGRTAMNEAIITGLDMLEQQKQLYKSLGVPYFRPWLFLMTDGIPTDNEYAADAKIRLNEAITGKKVTFFPLAVGDNASVATLKEYNNNGNVLKASAADFAKAFVWLSNSISTTANSAEGDKKVTLPPLPTQIEIEL